MDNCDAILKQGVFNEILTRSEKSVSENLLGWLTSINYQTLQSQQGGGLTIGLPIKGVPIQLGGSVSQEQFEQWIQAVNNQHSRQFSETEVLQIIGKSASPQIVDAWLTCKGWQGVGLKGSVVINDEDIIFTARYIPHSSTDSPPVVTGEFLVSGATSQGGFSDGDEIPFGGRAAFLKRIPGEQVTIVLNTTKGVILQIIPSEIVDVPSTELKPRLVGKIKYTGPFDDRFREVNDFAIKNGFVSGYPNFQQQRIENGETVFGVILIKPEAAEYRSVSVTELGNPSTDKERFRKVNDYAIENGFVSGYPNFHQGVENGVLDITLTIHFDFNKAIGFSY